MWSRQIDKRKIARSKLKTNISQVKSPEERRTGRQQKDSAGKDTPSNVIDYDEKLMWKYKINIDEWLSM